MLRTISRILHSGDGRTSLIKKNIIASFLIKGWSIIVQLLMVPLTLYCLGTYENGLWLTISAILLWIDNMDVGLGNGLRNKLAEYMAHEEREKARSAVSSTFFMLTVVVIPIVIIGNVLVYLLDVYSIFNVDDAIVGNLREVLSISLIFACSTFIFKCIGNLYTGLQLAAVNNLLVSLGHTVALAATFIVYCVGIHSLMLIAIINTASPLLVYLCAYPWTFFVRYPYLRPQQSLVQRDMVKSLLNTGVQFFVLQLSGIVLFLSSNLIISNLFTPSMVTPFQIAYRYFNVITLLFTILCVPYWSATTDAYQRGDFDWIKRSCQTINKMMIGMTGMLLLMFAVSHIVFHFWIGDEVTVSWSVTLLVALYVAILVYSTRYSFILNGMGALRLQIIVTLTATILYVPTALYVGRKTGSFECLLAVMCLINTPGLIINAVQHHKIINRKATGIWR